MKDNMSITSLAIFTLLTVCITHWVYRLWQPKSNVKLPPGSMGWPLIGESLQFFAPNTTIDIPPFIKKRMKRYGAIFRTSLMGKPIVVSTDADLNNYIFQEEGKLFESCYPDSFMEVAGQENMGSLQGFIHKHLKNMVLSVFGPESLKKMVPEVEVAVRKQLQRWSNVDTVELKDATAGMIFSLTAKKLISLDHEKDLKKLRESFAAFIAGLISLPLDIPGTAYHKCLKGKKKAMEMLKNMLHERRMAPRKQNEDFFDYVVEELTKEGAVLTETIALDLMFMLLFASFETSSLALTMAIKFLTDHPSVLQTLTEEHETILRQRRNIDSGFTWQEYKSMTFTFQFINETVRLANIAPVIFRKALNDINFKGYTIPSGWGIMVYPPAVHLDPSKYENPLQFNPWRWTGGEKNGRSKNFMAFGGGMRFCVGSDFTKLQMAVFLHCLVTKYKWKGIKGGNTLRNPGLQFPDGFHIKLFKKSTEEDAFKAE